MDSSDLINRLSLNIVFPDSGCISDISKEALERSELYYRDYIAGTIEDVFGLYRRYALQIGDISIDLGIVAPEEIPYKLSVALEQELQRHIGQSPSHLTTETDAPLLDSPSAIEGAASIDEFLEYLSNPVKPWYLLPEQPFRLEAITRDAIKSLCEDVHNSKQFARLIGLIVSDSNAFRRLIGLINSSELDRLIRKYLDSDLPFARTIQNISRSKEDIDNSETISDSRSTEDAIRFQPEDVYNHIVRKIATFSEYRKKSAEVGFLKHLLYGGKLPENLRPEYLFRNLSDSQRTPALTSELPKLQSEIGSSSGLPELQNEIGSFSGLSELQKETHLAVDLPKLYNETHSSSGLSEFQKETYSTLRQKSLPIPISNAGLILLTPMLPTIFNRLDYTDNRAGFRSLRSRMRAVHLLQYVTGITDKHYDYLLPLNKILCGVDPCFPIDPIFRPTKKEIEEAAALLKSVLTHWTVLRGTSVVGLQETFIRRNGIIEPNDSNWIVRVEGKTVDILLDQLPWNISVISMLWNEYLIYTEWKR